MYREVCVGIYFVFYFRLFLTPRPDESVRTDGTFVSQCHFECSVGVYREVIDNINSQLIPPRSQKDIFSSGSNQTFVA